VALVVGAVFLTLSEPLAGVVVLLMAAFALWAWIHPVTAASSLAFLTAAFPKAGVRIADFPFPVFLFGLIIAVGIMFVSSRRAPHGPVVLVIVGAYLTFAIARTFIYTDDGPAGVFAFVAWAIIPVVLLTVSTSLAGVDQRFIRAFQWGFLLSAAFALVQLAGGLEATAIPGLTQALGDDITDKHNVIYVQGSENFSKIPSTYHNGNIYGLAAAFFLIFSATRVFAGKGTKLDFTTVIAAVLAIGLSGSRAAIVAAAIPLLILLLRRGSLRWRIAIVGLGAFIVAAVLSIEPELARRYTIDSIVASGGSGRVGIWERTLATMRPTDFLFGSDSRAVLPDGWVGIIIQLGLVGTALLAAAVVTLMLRRPEWRVTVLVLLIGAVVDSSYWTFPTWFIPAAMMAGRLVTLNDETPAPTPPMVRGRRGYQNVRVVRQGIP
jgi:hypothetical protein